MKNKLCYVRNILSYVAILFLFFAKLAATSLDGTAGVVYQNEHYVFRNGDIAQGFVRLNGGFTILPAAQATMDMVVSVSRGIDLRETGKLQLIKDLVLDSGVTFSTGGYLNGRGYALDFRGTFTMPWNQVLHLTSDTIIDGKGGTLLFSPHSHLFVEQNTTLTLRNMTIHATRNGPLVPVFRCSGNNSRIALDNVVVDLADDFVFDRGRLFVHNDVVITGTHSFIYKSPMPLLIDSAGILTFDLGTGFSFAPTSTDQRLFVLKDQTSGLAFNGATFNATSTGVRFTKGNIFLDNKVVINSQSNVEVNGGSILTSTHYGLRWDVMSWSPDGRHLVVGGFLANPDGAAVANDHDTIVLYQFTGSTLVTVTSQSFSSSLNGHLYGLDWSRDGQYLAVSGDSGSAGLGGFTTTANVRIYKFAGSLLNPVTSILYPNFSSDTTRAKWRPDYQYLSVSGENAGVGEVDLLIYKFNGTSLTLTTSRQYSAAGVIAESSWSPDGKFFAVVGSGPVNGSSSGFANTDHIRIYSFDGTTLTPVTSQAYGLAGTVTEAAWSPDGKFLLVAGTGAASGSGGFANTDNVRLYAFNGTSLMPQASFAGLRPAAWHPDGKYITCRNSGATASEILRFDGSSLTSVASITVLNNLVDMGWDPTGSTLTFGTEDVLLYSTTFINPLTQPFSQAVIFGDSAAGSAFNCDVEVLGAAHVTVNGVVSDESV